MISLQWSARLSRCGDACTRSSATSVRENRLINVAPVEMEKRVVSRLWLKYVARVASDPRVSRVDVRALFFVKAPRFYTHGEERRMRRASTSRGSAESDRASGRAHRDRRRLARANVSSRGDVVARIVRLHVDAGSPSAAGRLASGSLQLVDGGGEQGVAVLYYE